MRGTIYSVRIKSDDCRIRVKYDHGGAEVISVDRDSIYPEEGDPILRPGVRVKVSGLFGKTAVSPIGVDEDHLDALKRLQRIGYDDGPPKMEERRLRNKVKPDYEP